MNKPPLPAASTVVVYVRDSTEQQGEEEIPIDGQVSELTAAAQDYGWNIYDVIRDVASGTSDKRPGFQRILTLAKSRTPPFEAVFVWKLSRFARNRDDSVIHKALLRKRGIKVLSYKENIPDGPIGRLIEGVIEAVDEFYTANVAEDTLRGLKEVARQGYHPGGRAPVGYVNDRVQVGTKRNGEPLFRTRWQLDAQKASLVRQAFEMAAAGNTFDDIIQATDVCVNKSSLSSILRNRAYIGSRVYNRERQAGSKAVRRRNDESDVVVVEHSHPAIVPREVFEQVQSRLRKYRSPVERQKRRHSPRLLSGLLVCALHNEPYTLTTTHRAYYQCRLRNRRGKKACDNALLDAKLVDKAIPDHLAQQLMVPANVDTMPSTSGKSQTL